MNRRPIATLLVASLVLLAGCSGGITGTPDSPATETTTTTEAGAMQGAMDGESGTVNLYISDEENAIGDFEHLNVTITRVGLKPAGDGQGSGDADEPDETEADDSDDGNETDVEGEPGDGDRTDSDDVDDGNETEVEDDELDGDGNETAVEDDVDDDSGESEADEEADSGDGEWVEYGVDNRTVDLTQLQGANATKLSSLDVPNGTYEKVFVYVSDVNGTLNDGSDQRVKLPSGKLQLNSAFTVGNGDSVDFVFDITAVKAGNSGKYILKPVISESGTDVEIERVDGTDAKDDDTDDDAADASDAEDRQERAASALNATFGGDVVPGENATLVVTRDGSAVANATVSVDDTAIGTTDADGELVVSVPEEADEIELAIARDGAETELEVAFDDRGGDGSNDSGEPAAA